MNLLLINPNTSAATTAAMVAIAQAAAPAGVTVRGATAPFGVPLITGPHALAVAAGSVAEVVRASDLGSVRGIVIAAFGDPGLAEARALARCPVTGIAEASMMEAAQGGRRFAVATTTPDLVDAIRETAHRYGYGAALAGVRVTAGDPVALMEDPAALEAGLDAACRAAITHDGAVAIVIGGGPLAVAARALAARLPVPVIEPVPAAVRLAVARARS
jgi:Asp/Glu/hydantoin racemase